MCLNIKSIYDKHAATFISNSEKLKDVFSKTRSNKRCPLLPLLINIELKV